MPNAILRKDIVFIEGLDIFENETDIQTLYWICKPDTRLDGGQAAQTASQCYLQWPAIPITILARRAMPAAPQGAPLSAVALTAFIANMATRRSEWDSAVKGLYLASGWCSMVLRGGP